MANSYANSGSQQKGQLIYRRSLMALTVSLVAFT